VQRDDIARVASKASGQSEYMHGVEKTWGINGRVRVGPIANASVTMPQPDHKLRDSLRRSFEKAALIALYRRRPPLLAMSSLNEFSHYIVEEGQ